jgi:hypothetical protein
MRRMLLALMLTAGFVGLGAGLGHDTASALPANAPALNDAAAAAVDASPLHKTYYERHGRRGVVKCYHELVIGPYRCHRYHYW